jgi:cobalt-zinc-cadmium efflux system membrane fusion protein
MLSKFHLYLIGTSLIFFTACSEKTPTEVAESDDFCIPDSLMNNITIDTVHTESVNTSIKLSGKITANEDHQVKIFPLAGGHVSEVKVSLGDFVTKGQVLAVVRSTDIANFTNDYKAAKSELAIAKKNLEVVTDMKNSGVNSEKDLLSAQGDYDKALAQFNKATQVLSIYGSSENGSGTSEYTIKSPINGFVIEKNINAGMELRADDANNIFTVADLKEVWATANVYESDIAKIKNGDNVEVTTLSYPGKIFTGKVERISNVINPETNVMTIKVSLANADYSLKPGMFASMSVLLPAGQQMMSVPSSAIIYDDNKAYVVQFKKRCDVDMQEVTVFKTNEQISYVVDDSLKANDLVVDRNALFIFTALKKR